MTPVRHHKEPENFSDIEDAMIVNCQEKHRQLNWVLGILVTLILGMIGVAGMSWSAAQSASARAQSVDDKTSQVGEALRIDQAKTTVFRENQTRSLDELRIWIRRMGDKQDSMSDALNRLVTLKENENKKDKP